MTRSIRRTLRSSPLAVGLLATMLLSGTALAQEPSASQDPSASAQPAAVLDGASPSPGTAEATPLGEEVGPLEPGTYVDDSVGVAVRFTLGEGWQVSGVPIESVGVELGPVESSAPAALTISRFDGVVFAAPCVVDEDFEAYFEETQAIEATAEAFVSHLAGNPYLAVGEPEPVEVGGIPGLQVDLTATIPEAECQPPVTFLWELPVVAEFHLNDGESARAIALDLEDGVLVVFIEAFPGVDWPAFLAEAMTVVESMAVSTAAG